MASREGQGMQIAVILFALVSALLAVTTYLFYAEASKLGDQFAQEKSRAEINDKGQKSATYKLTALKYTMGEATAPDLEAAKGQAGGAVDEDVNKWINQYKADVQILGDDPNNPKENYKDMVNRFLNIIASKNTSVSEANATLTTTQQQKDQQIADLTSAKKKAEDDLQAAITAYNAEKQKLSDQLTQATKEKDDLKTQFEDDKKALDASVATLNNQIADLNKRVQSLQSSLAFAQSRVEEMEADQGANFDNPDGLVNWVNQRQRLVWINLGSADGLVRQMTFSVFSQQQASAFKLEEVAKADGSGTDRTAKLDSKGRIEVVRITGAHEAECRILEDKPSNPILPGDWIQTPAWSPGQHLGIALSGSMDIDNDGLDDTELIKNLIRINGGTVDAQLLEDGTLEGAISVRTRYLVEGKIPTDAANADVKAFLDKLRTLEEERRANGVEKVSIGEFLERMGWKPEEKTIGLGGRSDVGAGQFRRRTPGAKAAAEPAPMPMPMPATPGTPSTEDPFGTKE
jgi:hypothetical protein